MTQAKAWSFAVGQRARPYRVTVYENMQRGGVLSLRWLAHTDGHRKSCYESLGRGLRTADGKIIRDVERWAKAKAQEKHEALMRGDAERASVAADIPLTIGEAQARITDAQRGKYPRPTQHRRETIAALIFACSIWGAQRTWNGIKKADLRALARARVDQLRAQGHDGIAGAEHTVQRVLTVAQWLRDEEMIDAGAAVASKNWKEELRTYWLEVSERHELPTPSRPRYTIQEAFKIIAAAERVDPRLALILWLAPNQRMQQVARLHRSNVFLSNSVIRIPTRGKKKGAVISLTVRERDALNDALTVGYLRDLEAKHLAGKIADYPVFPAGQMHGGRVHRRGTPSDRAKPKSWRAPDHPVARLTTTPSHRRPRTKGAAVSDAPQIVNRTTIRNWFKDAERLAKVPPIDGRGPYGVRRAFTDAGKEERLSREGLTALGGWADPQMADRIYADDEAMYAAEEARDFRARMQDKHLNEPAENRPISQQTHNSASEAEGAVGQGDA